jgi:Protein of unknown function (DUF2442)
MDWRLKNQGHRCNKNRIVNDYPLLDGVIFEPLRDPADFGSVTLDSICGTVVWPNGADFAPEALHDLDAEAMSESAV